MAAILDYTAYFLAGYTALTIFFYMLGFIIPKAAFVARALASYFSLIASSLFGVGSSVFFSLIGYGGLSQWAVGRSFKLFMKLSTGVCFSIEDPNNYLNTTRPAVFVGNHQTELDVLMLGTIFPKWCSVTAKASLKKMPFLGWFMALSGSIFIDRKNSKDAREAMAGAAKEIREKKQSVYMFPEGTRSYSKEPELLPFKKGAFHLAVQAQVPIVPVVVANYSHVLYIKGLVFRSGTIPCKVLEPISTKGLTSADVDELTRTTRELMLKEIIVLTEKARGKRFAAPRIVNQANGVAKVTGSDMRVAA
ncbi:putative 1-acyl-sn-glycerol-3-phosphate acyltransferase [Podospora fimiseda]|uniref:1-acyl-sn-glycerol-3-phosphate acyltransferase n=1 Tax=Podospora fimiseda TaxID=252190 RepID=A0AAN7H8I6_9PEZI|nr:putative 1-acyl-sn-glycerol-3-phosphate acyltransferase [Podospora fimiseda]